jgi:MFS family permease
MRQRTPGFFHRILISWGIVSACTAFVRGPSSLMLVRFVLGVAEAGFFPGVILYLAYWFPARYRAHVVALFFAANPIPSALGSPVRTYFTLRPRARFRGMAMAILSRRYSVGAARVRYAPLPDRSSRSDVETRQLTWKKLTPAGVDGS